MNRKVDRTQTCTRADALIRLGHAQRYLEIAEGVIDHENAEHATVATGNAVLAAIAAADAICCATAGSRYRGSEHRQAADYLELVTSDKKLAALLRDVVDFKDVGHYGLSNVALSRAKSVFRKADQLVSAARDRVR